MDPDPGSKRARTKKEKNVRGFHVLKSYMFSLKGWVDVKSLRTNRVEMEIFQNSFRFQIFFCAKNNCKKS